IFVLLADRLQLRPGARHHRVGAYALSGERSDDAAGQHEVDAIAVATHVAAGGALDARDAIVTRQPIAVCGTGDGGPADVSLHRSLAGMTGIGGLMSAGEPKEGGGGE